MLQQTSLTQTLVAPRRTLPPTNGVRQALAGSRWQHVSDVLQLPTGIYSFLVYCIALILLVASMSVHIMLSTQVKSKDLELRSVQASYAELQRKNANLTWHLNQNVTLDAVYAQAVAQGFEPMVERNFVVGNKTVVRRLDENTALVMAQP